MAEAHTAPTVRDDIAFWLYTSGSTGKPKGAVHVHADLKLTDDLYGGPFLGITENDVCYSVAKLFFAYGLGNALTFPMSAGACTVLLPDRPTPDGVAALLRKHPVTVFYAVPTFYAAFLASPAAPQRAEVKFRCCVSAGEALPEDVGKRWLERYGVDILDGIGSTEMLHIFLSNRAGRGEVRHHRQAGAGLRPASWSTTTALPVKQGEMGELLVTGPIERDHVLEQPRAVAHDLHGRMDALRRQIRRGRGRLFRLLRPPRRHAQGVRHVRLAVRGRGRAAAPIRTCWRPRWWPGPTATA